MVVTRVHCAMNDDRRVVVHIESFAAVSGFVCAVPPGRLARERGHNGFVGITSTTIPSGRCGGELRNLPGRDRASNCCLYKLQPSKGLNIESVACSEARPHLYGPIFTLWINIEVESRLSSSFISSCSFPTLDLSRELNSSGITVRLWRDAIPRPAGC
jgi:hypothetical protein